MIVGLGRLVLYAEEVSLSKVIQPMDVPDGKKAVRSVPPLNHSRKEETIEGVMPERIRHSFG